METAAMLAFRIASPLGWIAALILFFLPWVDISCRWREAACNRRRSVAHNVPGEAKPSATTAG
jgi:hypothetical protein